MSVEQGVRGGSINSDLRWDYESGDADEPLIRGSESGDAMRLSPWAHIRKHAWIVPVIYTHLWAAAVISLVAPFFPPLADSRGIPAWKYGFFFSTMKLMMLPGAVIAEKLISGVSARAGYLGGQVATALFSVTCGFLYWIKSGNILLGTSLLMAAFGGCCNTVYSVCLYTLLTSRFKDDGGMLILWAFPLPFFVIGGVLLLSLPFMALINPRSSKHECPTNDIVPQQECVEKKYWTLIYDLIFIVNLGTVTISWAMTSFNEPTLEPFLRQFNMSSTQVGTVFTVQFVGYSIGALLGGLFAKFKMEPFLNFFGMLLSTIGYIILGPIPIIPILPYSSASAWQSHTSAPTCMLSDTLYHRDGCCVVAPRLLTLRQEATTGVSKAFYDRRGGQCAGRTLLFVTLQKSASDIHAWSTNSSVRVVYIRKTGPMERHEWFQETATTLCVTCAEGNANKRQLYMHMFHVLAIE
ncbi:MFS-type transporter SLC18B1 isoform X3 [Rhipicephalus microplus]|uniref:MFS-type transporter SLC18B1 isoform X3 n=1 Tax=Rhipicephalus microplus TaxID=6941 RepID=UPI003F6ADE39